MSSPPKLQMSDIPQELIDQLKDRVRVEVEADFEKKIDAVKKQVKVEVREQLRQQPPRDVLVEALGAVCDFFMRTSSTAHAKQA
ncbi:hypothetical protein HYH02_010064 [Chlamydomonas schloesseri]|uniref:Uncharacterized protein n=1 Tax=Chlamydomonas schloesseri TaxID=2026947 RepID=A0A835W6I3_9CHLO|nr:hypothetical protein HYH02_010064 [Chlamydomonas schloesseri]|eukprot:KAG2441220.1 hypothetical protein HYH02_010064 [Chlamydomonas schloesseri]